MTDKRLFSAIEEAKKAMKQVEDARPRFDSSRLIKVDTSHQDMMRKIDEEHRKAAYHRDNPVVRAFESLKQSIISFERGLDEEHEIGLRLAASGSGTVFHARTITSVEPDLIVFDGVDGEGNVLRLIQHFTQLNFLLKKVPKVEDTARRIGFVIDD